MLTAGGRANSVGRVASIRVTNDVSDLLCVFIEPCGEDYWIRRRQVLHLVADIGGEAIEIIAHPQGLSVWAGAADHVDAQDEEGRPLVCGHQRPPDAFGGA